MSYAGRITYNSINIDLLRTWTEFNFRKIQNQSVLKSSSGIRQALNFYNQDTITVRRDNITPQEIRQFLEWYNYVYDGSSFILLRDRDLGIFVSFEGKSLYSNDENNGTFTRVVGTGSNATYIDAHTGYLTVISSANIARHPAGKFGDGVLVEGARTNICQQPNNLGAAGWTATDITVTATTTETTDPAGGNNASKLLSTAANGSIAYDTAVSAESRDGVASFWVKCPTGTVSFRLGLIDDIEVRGTTATFVATTEWQKVQVASAANAGSGYWLLVITIVKTANTIYAYGCQVEEGTAASDTLFASQTILTSGTTLARNAELLLYTAANVINQTKGTIAFWFKPEWSYNAHPYVCLFHSGADSTNRHISLGVLANGIWEYKAYRLNSTNNSACTPTAVAITQNAWNHVAITYDSTISNGLKIYFNGTLLATSTNDAFSASGIGTNFALGSFNDGGCEAFCIFDELLIRKDVLSATEISNIANRTTGLGIGRNRWTTVALTNPEFDPIWKVGDKYNIAFECEEVLS